MPAADRDAANVLRVGQRVWWKRNPMFLGRITSVRGERRKRYMVKWDAWDNESGEYGISEFLVEAQRRV